MTVDNIIDFGAEMGFNFEELLNLSWREYDYYSTGYLRRIERGFDETRHLIAAMYNSSGFSKTKVKPRDIIKLPLLDKAAPFKKMSKKRFDKLVKLFK